MTHHTTHSRRWAVCSFSGCESETTLRLLRGAQWVPVCSACYALLGTVENSPVVPDNPINPSHYKGTGLYVWDGQNSEPRQAEVIDIIEAFDLDRYDTNAIKYILRAGRKVSPGETAQQAALRDIKKADWYLRRKVSWLENSVTTEATDNQG